MAENKSPQGEKSDRDQGTVLDRIKMPPMSGEEALRRFSDERSELNPESNNAPESDLAQLHPVMKLVALGGTLLLIVSGLLGVLYLFAA